MGEIAAFAQMLSQTGILTAIQGRVRFARACMGTYELIDFVVVLRSPSNRLYEPFTTVCCLLPMGFMALFDCSRLPSRSALSRYLPALDQTSVESLRTWFQEDLLARTPFADPAGIKDRCGQSWAVANVDGTR